MGQACQLPGSVAAPTILHRGPRHEADANDHTETAEAVTEQKEAVGDD